MLDKTNRLLPAPYEPPHPGPVPVPSATFTLLPEQGQPSVPLVHYLWILQRHRWHLLSFMAFCMVAALLVSLRLTPIYEATATVDIDRQSPPGIIGQEATRAALNDADQYLATQVRLIQSDSVLRPVAHKYHLRDLEGAGKSDLEEAPVVLKKLKVSRPPSTYLLLISYRSTDPKLSADAANAIARSYITTTFDLRFKASANLAEFMEKQIEELKAKMERSTAALAQFERELNVINPEQKTSILSARLLQLNTEYTSAQADRVRKEAAQGAMSTGSIEAAQSSTQGESLRKLSEHLNEAREKFVQVQAQYGANHPEYRKAASQVGEIERLLQKSRDNIALRVDVEHGEAVSREQMLRKAVAQTKAEFDAVNARSFQYQQVKREAEADKKLYDELVTRIREAGINSNFQNSSIRLADAARPPAKPVFPNLTLNLMLALLFSALFGIGAAILADVLNDTLRDPEEAGRSLNTAIIGTLPAVKAWRKRLGPIAVAGESTALVKLEGGLDEPASGFAESVRTLRNSILLADFDRRLKTILVTSASPSEGKSTTAAFLALSHAEQGKKTLLIDADLRRPSLHRRFDLSSASGLSNVVLREINWRAAVVPVPGNDSLELLPAGPPSRRSVDLVGSEIAEVLEEVSRDYDLIIVDSPPLLGFSEPLQMSTLVDGVVVVARAGVTSRKAVASVLDSLYRLRANVLGAVLNEIKREHSNSYYYYYRSYGKYYTRAQNG